MQAVAIFLAGLALPAPAIAQMRMLGHNLTPTTSVLAKGEAMLGTYAGGYGLTESLTVSTSTWLDVSYNMPNIGVKCALPSSTPEASASLELIYFKTFPFGWKLFEQESAFARATYGITPFAGLDVFFSGGFQYFWNDRRAFSLRAIPQRSDPKTLSISTLSNVHLSEHLSAAFELGVLGMNYPTSFLHYGASLNLHFDRWMLQFGYSVSRTLTDIEFEVDHSGRMYWSGTSQGITVEGPVSLVHPEIQLQFVF